MVKNLRLAPGREARFLKFFVKCVMRDVVVMFRENVQQEEQEEEKQEGRPWI